MAKEKEVLSLEDIKSKLEDLDKQHGKDKSAEPKKTLLKQFLQDEDYKNLRKDLVKELVPLTLKKPTAAYNLVYDSLSEGLEPIYYWILDFIRDTPPGGLGLEVFKGPEEFEASVTSGYFGEMGQRSSLMQQKATEYLGAINQVIKSILNLIYDLKEFEIRLKSYDDLKSDDPDTRRGADFSLKGIWMDTVDAKKGRGSINLLAQDLQFATIRDAFFWVDDEKKLEDLDLNDRVRRLVARKYHEYKTWRDYSEKEIKKRYEVERAYLRSQVGTLKLYASWAKPYLKAAQRLKMKEFNVPDIVNSFSNIEIKISILGKREIKPESLHESYKHLELGDTYYAVIEAEMDFRGVPSAVTTAGGRQYVHGGRADIKFRAYGLDKTELQALESRELYEDMDLIDQWVDVSLKELQTEIDKYLTPPEPEHKKAVPKGKIELPFKGTIEGFKTIFSPLSDAVQQFLKPATSTAVIEEDLKKHAEETASTLVTVLYNVYKKAHGQVALT